MEVLDCIKFLLAQSWNALCSITVPGFKFSFATLFIGLFLADLGLRFLGMILGGIGFGRGDVENAERMHIERNSGTWPLHIRRYK